MIVRGIDLDPAGELLGGCYEKPAVGWCERTLHVMTLSLEVVISSAPAMLVVCPLDHTARDDRWACVFVSVPPQGTTTTIIITTPK